MNNNNIKKIFLNGQEYQTEVNFKIIDIIYYLNYKKKIFIIEYNGSICDKKMWNKINIKNNDKIEIITIVGGG
jgi:sulfur carrier protein